MGRDAMLAVIDAATEAVRAAADRLTDLDRAVGDGDHGTNMRRGFDAIAAQREALAAMEPGDALQKAGMVLVSTVGGASGPLYGSLLIAAGKALKEGQEPAEAFAAGVESVKRRGKSDVGAKTMLDVLVPLAEALKAGSPLAALPQAAAERLAATRDMVATRGRASFLGERSRGHEDPGAASATLLVEAVCGALGGRA